MDPKGDPWGLLGVIWGPVGDFLGSLDVLLAAVGFLGGPLGIPGVSWDVPGRLWGDFRDFPGNSGRPFGSILRSFLVFVRSLFGVCFLTDFLSDFASMLVSFLKLFCSHFLVLSQFREKCYTPRTCCK